ncbi:hypothetical protein N665_0051s0027 [Sinapis alba]|nr:hypothetical protein N665_0051s0027 [Sinapis alba]
MDNLTKESNVNVFAPSQDKQLEDPEDFTMPMTYFRPASLKRPSFTDIDEPEVCCKVSDYALIFVPEDKWSKLIEWSLNPNNQIILANDKFQGNKRGYNSTTFFLIMEEEEHQDRGSIRHPHSTNCQAVQPSDKKNDLNVKQYTVSYVPMRSLNKTGNDCGAYALKFIECHVFGLDFSLVNNENIQEVQHKIAYDLSEAANDEVSQYRMSTFKALKCAPEKVVDLSS